MMELKIFYFLYQIHNLAEHTNIKSTNPKKVKVKVEAYQGYLMLNSYIHKILPMAIKIELAPKNDDISM